MHWRRNLFSAIALLMISAEKVFVVFSLLTSLLLECLAKTFDSQLSLQTCNIFPERSLNTVFIFFSWSSFLIWWSYRNATVMICSAIFLEFLLKVRHYLSCNYPEIPLRQLRSYISFRRQNTNLEKDKNPEIPTDLWNETCKGGKSHPIFFSTLLSPFQQHFFKETNIRYNSIHVCKALTFSQNVWKMFSSLRSLVIFPNFFKITFRFQQSGFFLFQNKWPPKQRKKGLLTKMTLELISTFFTFSFATRRGFSFSLHWYPSPKFRLACLKPISRCRFPNTVSPTQQKKRNNFFLNKKIHVKERNH